MFFCLSKNSKIRLLCCVSLLTLLFLAEVHRVVGHGWLVTPVPASGGGLGSGNASQRSPCGNLNSMTVQGSYPAGSSINVTYMRANSHGTTCNCVSFTASYTAAATNTPSATDFTGTNGISAASALKMDVGVSSPQPGIVTLPSTAGKIVLQFKWSATDGSTWYDCAYLQLATVTGPNPCLTNNGGCTANSQCTEAANGSAVCTCNSGFYMSSTTCTPLPPNYSIQLLLNVPSFNSTLQNALTDSLAALLNFPAGRILYDHANDTSNGVMVYFSLAPDTVTGASGESAALELEQMVSQNSSQLAMLGYPVSSVQITTLGSGPVTTGSNSNSIGSTASTSDANGVIAGAIVSSVVLAALLIYAQYYRRRMSQHSTTVKMVAHPPTAGYTSSSASQLQSNNNNNPYNSNQANNNTSPRAEAPLPAGWSRYLNDDGIPYFYNENTGESVWVRPT